MTDSYENLKSALADRYTIERELGAGGMATVYLAHDIKHDRKVAVKVLRPELAAVIGTDRFLQEIRIAAQLNHPHTLQLYDSGEAAGFPYYVMPFVDGGSLRGRLGKEDMLPIAECVRLLKDIADALADAHAQGVVHRDIKPDNVMLRGRHALVTDFGVAKAVSEATASRQLTTAGVALGTPTYMAPEQAAADPNVDHRADIYAFGVVAYELLTGVPPFSKEAPHAVLAAHLVEQPTAVTDLRPEVGTELGALVMQCLGKAPGERPQSCDEIVEKLESMSHSSVATPAVLSSGRAAEKPTVAVLPFTSMSSASDDEYFSDGMTEDIIAQLSQIESLRVISRTSAMRYKNAEQSMKEIAAKLGASHVVEGSVRRAANRVRIVAQLIEAGSDAHLWAQTFDRSLDDVFAIQSEVAERIAKALQARLSPSVRERFGKRPTDDQEAYNAYLMARHHVNLATADGFNTAVALYRDAVAKDPGFARAWASIAVAHHFHLAGYYGVRPRDAAVVIVENATRALELDPDIAEAHMMLGQVEELINHDWEAARMRSERALALSPNLSAAHLMYGNYLAGVGRLEEAVEAGQRALELDPAAEIVHVHANWLCYLARQYDRALAGLEAAETQFGRKVIPLTIGETLIALGRAEEAVESFRELCERIPISWNQIHLAWGLAAAGEQVEAREVLNRVREQETQEHVWYMGIAVAYAHLGDMDEAFKYLQRSHEEREAWTQFSLAPAFDPMRGDPRFDGMASRVGGVSPEQLEACRRHVIDAGGAFV